MNATQRHTPTPWEVVHVPMANPVYQLCYDGRAAVQVVFNPRDEAEALEADANLALIVRACNSHEDMLSLLTDIF